MSNVVYLNVPGPQERRAATTGALIRSFAQFRRGTEDVFWLKENAELLNILDVTGQTVPSTLLEPYAAFYQGAFEKLVFFPQYYRFILSLTLDLESLGMPGDTAQTLCAWAHDNDLAGGETSDIQRLEAYRLMQRRGFDPLRDQDGAQSRLRDFISRPDRFALPNKKAAFELTHIVFYLSQYGKTDPQIGLNGLRSLENAGLLAFLDGNVDLLAEICVAMRYAGHNPSAIWENWVAQKMKDIEVQQQDATTVKSAGVSDQYHEFLTTSWLAGTRGDKMFAVPSLEVSNAAARTDLRLSFHRDAKPAGALREMSVHLFRMGTERRENWHNLRSGMDSALSEGARARLELAENSSPEFGAFFEDFARVAPSSVQQASA